MSLFKKIFGSKSKPQQDINPEAQRGKYMPQIELPIDERFTINFRKNGGKFLYCDSFTDVYDSLENILAENNWEAKEVLCFDERLQERFDNFDMKFSRINMNASFFLSSCEYLIADNGSILVCSNQIKEKKLNDLPDNFVILAHTSQLKAAIGEGLRGIKNKYKSNIPSNITTIKHFQVKEEKDFLSYGSSSKNLYLLLLEDL
ncbi:LUD domain protein [Kordia sp. SMS9]|uniref:LUD domain-containing protein n=1 Tax=Kordia sp. SMS9 TaxID=2282170 RepID=UPI000E0CCD74|nr:LUD domain-containing protein [Kordia sp. SMS9]AXG70070.1 LUD domain protein [Kordia sp. SMS9]